MIQFCEADINIKNLIDGYTTLHWAVENGNLDLVLFLIHQGAKINETTNNWEQSKHIALRNGHIDIQRLLETKACIIEEKKLQDAQNL